MPSSFPFSDKDHCDVRLRCSAELWMAFALKVQMNGSGFGLEVALMHSSCEVAKQLYHDFNHCLVAALNWNISSGADL